MIRLLAALLVAIHGVPLHAAGREIATPPFGPTPWMTYGEQVAGAGERFLAVWSERVGVYGTHVLGSILDARGRRLSGRPFEIVQGAVDVDLVGTGTSWALFFTRYRDDWTREVLLADISLDGRVTRMVSVAVPVFTETQYAWDGSRFLVLIEADAGQPGRILLLDRDGRIVRDVGALESIDASHPMATDRDFVAVLAGPVDGTVLRVRPDGTASRGVLPEADGGVALRDAGNGLVEAAWLVRMASVCELRTAVIDESARVVEWRIVGRVDEWKASAFLEPLDLGMWDGGPQLLVRADRQSPPARTSEIELWRFDAEGLRSRESIGPAWGDRDVASNAAVRVVVSSRREAPRRAATTVIAPSGSVVAGQELAQARARHDAPLLVSAAGRVLAVWIETSGDGSRLRSAVLDGDGRTIRHRTVAIGSSELFAAAWNGSQFLVVHRAGQHLVASRLDLDGEPVDDEPILLDPVGGYGEPWHGAAAAWHLGRWVVVFNDGLRLRAVTVSDGGAASEPWNLPEVPPPSSWPRRAGSLAAASSGSDLLVVWNDEPACDFHHPCPDEVVRTFAWRVPAERGAEDPSPVEIALPGPAGPVALATSGEEFLLLRGGTVASIELDGGQPRFPGSRVLFEFPEELVGDVSWTGRDYAVVLGYLRHIAVWRIDRAASVIGSPGGTAVGMGPSSWSIAAAEASNALVGLAEGDLAGGLAATTRSESDLQPLPDPPDPPQHVDVQPAVNPDGWPGWRRVVWEPPARGDVLL